MFTAVAQPAEGFGGPPDTAERASRSTEARLGASEDLRSRGAPERRVPCDRVISQIDREGHGVDESLIARSLGTSVAWVERCMLAYGRRPRGQGGESAESKENLMESWEQNEPEERGAEEIEEPGALSERGLGQKQLRKPIPPTPRFNRNRVD
jgi:hypothetical protein